MTANAMRPEWEMVTALKRELDEMRERAETAERQLRSITGMERTRLAELKFKEGYDARAKEERALTPKAKAYRDALRAFIDAVTSMPNGSMDSDVEWGNRVMDAVRKAEALLR